MKFRSMTILVAALALCAFTAITELAQAPADSNSPALTADRVVDRALQRERELMKALTKFTPMVETYIQNLAPDRDLGAVPTGDKYFLSKLDMKHGVQDNSLLPVPGFMSRTRQLIESPFKIEYLPRGFASMIFIDEKNFDRANYDFAYVRREFLGQVRCFVFDVKPKRGAHRTAFIGRIWIEDRDFNIVRFNGTYTPSSGSNNYFHFDSWRENLAQDLWLPTYIYTEESDFAYLMDTRKLRFKGQTRLWGYDAAGANQQQELTEISVESDRVQDSADAGDTPAPVQNLRSWERQAEDNTLNRIQSAGLLAPEGPVDQVMETVLNNLEVTNNLDIEPGVRARVLLTTPLESFTVGNTVVVSRGLIDVLPDEASLASILAHELAHISLGHQIDTKYAFSDRLLFDDTQTFKWLTLKRDEKEEAAADAKAAEFMKASPYKDKLGNAGLFLRALQNRGPQLPNLLTPHLGNMIASGGKVRRMADLMAGSPKLETKKIDQVAALPIGSRLHIDPWDDHVELIQAKPATPLFAREKMPFEIAPVFLNLKRRSVAQAVAK
ncbi:MAG TPA: M48 family metalloprotease [Terriglobia bacterium]|jgi:hypothetical protein